MLLHQIRYGNNCPWILNLLPYKFIIMLHKYYHRLDSVIHKEEQDNLNFCTLQSSPSSLIFPLLKHELVLLFLVLFLLLSNLQNLLFPLTISDCIFFTFIITLYTCFYLFIFWILHCLSNANAKHSILHIAFILLFTSLSLHL